MLSVTTDKLFSGIAERLPSAAWALEFSVEMAAFALLLSFIGLAGLESRLPARHRSRQQNAGSYLTNLGLFVFNNIVASGLSIVSLYWLADRFSGHGLLAAIGNPMVEALVAFLAFDLSLYVWHVVCHRYDLLWQFHRVHHNDPYLNVSTAFRLHIVEMLLTYALKALVVIFLGIDKVVVLAIETLITLSIMFHHANIVFPGEHLLSRLLIVPYLHRVHHSIERSEHDSNYGAVLSFWDRLFGTLLVKEVARIGIKGESPLDVFGLVMFGFGGMTTPAAQAPAYPVELETMIAVAAYYRAEKRNFQPGDDQRDWHEARADILAQFGTNRQRLSQRMNPVQKWLHAKWESWNESCRQQKFTFRHG